MSEQKKYPIGGYAPGPYYHKCRECGNEYYGDKLAIQCEPCALKFKEFYDGLTPDQKERFDKRNGDILKLFFEVRDLKQENTKLREVLELAEAEIKAMYRRIGIKNSNVLESVVNSLKPKQ